MIQKNRIDFNEICKYPELQLGRDKSLRYMTNNVGLILLLEYLGNEGNKSQKFWISNVHIFWNPKFEDVKLMQTYYLLLTLQKLRENNPYPVILLGDFNSTPDSNVFEYLSKGSIPKKRTPTFLYQYFNFYHSLKLSSAYSPIYSPYTNFTPSFTGCLDYIWYDTFCFDLIGIVGPLEDNSLLPNINEPSDHCYIMSRLAFTQ